MKKTSSFKKALSVFLSLLMLLSCVSAFPADVLISAEAEEKTVYPTANGLSVDENGDFTILQVADMQGCYPLPDQWLNALRLSIATSQPDLIVLTGDNVTGAGDLTGFKNTVQQIVNEFYTYETSKDGDTYSTEKKGIPFAVTFGNHDYEANNNLALSTQLEAYAEAATKAPYAVAGKTTFIPLNTDGLGANVPVGTGYINVFDKYLDANSDGQGDVVQRVILINTGAKQDGGYARAGVDPATGNDYYSNVVSCVNTWTNTNYPTSVFQHIPLQEFYAAGYILKKDSSGLGCYSTNNSSISGGYSPNYANANTTGIYTETCCCSYNSTSEMYNALAKNNVVGLFYGHDHGNTLTGVTTVGGKSLRQGYGGGLNTQWNGSGTSQFSCYTINSAYSGINDTAHFNKESHAYADYLDEIGGIYGPKTNINGVTSFIKDLGAEAAPLSIFQTKKFETAVSNVREHFSYAINKMANDSGANADLNKGCGDRSKYVAVGYNTTTNANDAVTGIIGYRTTSGTHPNTITVYLQDNTPITYYLERNNCDCSGGVSDYYTLIYYTKDPKAGPPITNLYITYENSGSLWAHYNYNTKDNVPNYKVDSWVEQKSDGSWYLQEWNAFDYNTGCGSGTPYIYIEYASDGTEDVTRAYYDLLVAYNKYGNIYDDNHQIYSSESYNLYNSARNDLSVDSGSTIAPLNALKGAYSPYSSDEINKLVKDFVDAYNALALKPVENGKQVTTEADNFSDYQIVVPETIYLKANASSATTSEYFLNNKFNANGEVVPDTTTTSTGTFEIRCKDSLQIDIQSIRMKSFSSGNKFQFNTNKNNTTYYYGASELTVTSTVSNGTVKSGSSLASKISYTPGSDNDVELVKGSISELKLASGLAPTETGLIEWCFTVTRATGVVETAYAYTTVYAPYLGSVACEVARKRANFWVNEKDRAMANGTVWVTGIFSISQNSQGTNDAIGTFNHTPLTENWLLGTGTSGVASTTSCADNNSDPTTANDLRYTPGGTGYRGYWDSAQRESGTTTALGCYEGNITVDPSRYSNLSQIPNLLGGADIQEQWDANKASAGTVVIKSGDNVICTSAGVAGQDPKQNYQGFRFGAKLNLDITSRPVQTTVQANITARVATANPQVNLNINYVDKFNLRKTIGNYERLSPQASWLQAGNETTYSNYYTELAMASYNAGNPTSNGNSVSTTALETAFMQIKNNQKRSDMINGVNTKFFTLETNYSLKGLYNGYGELQNYVVDKVLLDTFKYEGVDDNGDGVGDGIGSLETIMVKPYDFAGYTYIGWMDGEGYLAAYLPHPELWNNSTYNVIPKPGDQVSIGQKANLYEDFNTSTEVNYGHIVKQNIDDKLNEFYFYYLPDACQLTFDLNGGSFTYGSNTYSGTSYKVNGYKGDSFNVAITPTKANAVFDGWTLTTASSTGSYNNGTKVFTFGSGNATLKAKWIENRTLTIDLDGGKFSGAQSLTVTQLEGTTFVIPDPFKDNHEFRGWTLTSGGGSVYQNSEGQYVYYFGTSNGTIKAQWTPVISVVYDNIFNLVEWSNNTNSYKLGGSGKTSGDLLECDISSGTIHVKDDGNAAAVYNSDGTFNKYSNDVYTAYTGNSNYYNMTVEPNTEYQVSYTVTGTGSAQLYVFTYTSANASENIVGSSYPHKSFNTTATANGKYYSDTFTTGANAVKLQIRFGFTSANADVTFSNIKITPVDNVWEDDAHRTLLVKDTKIDNMYAPVREGYTFMGWFTDRDVTLDTFAGEITEANAASYGYTNNGDEIGNYTTVWSRWVLNDLVVNYDGNGATGGSTAKSEFKYNADQNAKANSFTNSGKEFLFWNTEADGTGTSYTSGSSIKNIISSGETTLYAQWAKDEKAYYDFALPMSGEVMAQTPVSSVFNKTADNILPAFSISGGVLTGSSISPLYSKENGAWTKWTEAVPASNVLYEDTMLKYDVKQTGDTTDDKFFWTQVNSGTSYQAQSKANSGEVFGFDSKAYTAGNEYSNGTVHSVVANKDQITSKNAEFKFTGKGFDIYSVCGKNTGIMLVKVVDSKGTPVSMLIIDTYFSGDDIRQVPVAHFYNSGAADTYTVTVAGAYMPSAGGVTKNSNSSAGGSAKVDSDYVKQSVIEQLDEAGYIIEDPDMVEFFWADENSVLNGGTGNAGTAAANENKAGSGTTGGEGNNVVVDLTTYIDGVRIYNPLGNTENGAYPASETNAKYVNVISGISGVALNPEFGFVDEEDPQNVDPNFTGVSDYLSKGGPEYEVYLKKATSSSGTRNGVSFTVKKSSTAGSDPRVMIGLRSVNGTAIPRINANGLPIGTQNGETWSGELTSATEKYYDITSIINENNTTGNITVVIENVGDGMLAVNNVKLVGYEIADTSNLMMSSVKSLMKAPMRLAAVKSAPSEPGTTGGEETTAPEIVFVEHPTVAPAYMQRPEPTTRKVEYLPHEVITDPAEETTASGEEPTGEITTEPSEEESTSAEPSQGEKNFFEKIVDFFKSLFEKIRNLFSTLFAGK